jgi:hypothetical protein
MTRNDPMQSVTHVSDPLRQRSCRLHLVFDGGEEAIAT